MSEREQRIGSTAHPLSREFRPSHLPTFFSLHSAAAPPTNMLASYDDLEEAPLAPWPAPPLPPATEQRASATLRAPTPPLPPRTPRVTVSPAAAAALATAAATAALAGAPPPSLPPLKKGKRKAVALDDISDLQERRRQRRLAKNRATAAVSRERKHAQMQALTVTVYDLQKRNAELSAALAAKEAELAAVRAGLPYTPVAPRTAAPSTRRGSSRRAAAVAGEALASIDE